MGPLVTLIRDQRGLTDHLSKSHFSDEEAGAWKGRGVPQMLNLTPNIPVVMLLCRAPQMAKMKTKTQLVAWGKRQSVCRVPRETPQICSVAQPGNGFIMSGKKRELATPSDP